MKESHTGLENYSRKILKICAVCSVFVAACIFSAAVMAEGERAGPGTYSTALINVTARDAVDLSGQNSTLSSGKTTFEKLPLADYPMAIAERSELDLIS